MAPFKLVLTGGPCAGKTTLARVLAARGGVLVAEAAIEVITDLCREMGTAAQAEWRARHPVEFQRRIAERQREAERAALARDPGWIVCDRGLPDGLAYLRRAGVEAPPDLASWLHQARYDLVLVLDTLSAFEPRPETGRIDDVADSHALRDALTRAYRELGHAPVFIPAGTLDERIAQLETLLPVRFGLEIAR